MEDKHTNWFAKQKIVLYCTNCKNFLNRVATSVDKLSKNHTRIFKIVQIKPARTFRNPNRFNDASRELLKLKSFSRLHNQFKAKYTYPTALNTFQILKNKRHCLLLHHVNQLSLYQVHIIFTGTFQICTSATCTVKKAKKIKTTDDHSWYLKPLDVVKCTGMYIQFLRL